MNIENLLISFIILLILIIAILLIFINDTSLSNFLLGIPLLILSTGLGGIHLYKYINNTHASIGGTNYTHFDLTVHISIGEEIIKIKELITKIELIPNAETTFKPIIEELRNLCNNRLTCLKGLEDSSKYGLKYNKCNESFNNQINIVYNLLHKVIKEVFGNEKASKFLTDTNDYIKIFNFQESNMRVILRLRNLVRLAERGHCREINFLNYSELKYNQLKEYFLLNKNNKLQMQDFYTKNKLKKDLITHQKVPNYDKPSLSTYSETIIEYVITDLSREFMEEYD